MGSLWIKEKISKLLISNRTNVVVITNKWQSFGIPCSHVLAVCAHARFDSWQYVDRYFTMDAYARCYAPQFFPIPHKLYWPEPNFPILHPNPTLLREKGRPRSSRIRNEMDWKELSVKIQCGICKNRGT